MSTPEHEARWRAFARAAVVIALLVATGCSSDSDPSTPKSTTPSSPDISAPGPVDSGAKDVTGATSGNGVGGIPPDSSPSTGSP